MPAENPEKPIKNYHQDFAQALVALAREHGVGSLQATFRRSSSSVFRSDDKVWDSNNVTMHWHEERHGAQAKISLRAEARDEINETPPTQSTPGAEE